MKVFSLDKYLQEEPTESYARLDEMLKACEGKTKVECAELGLDILSGWVEAKRRIFCYMPEDAPRYYEDITFIPFVDNDGYETVLKVLKVRRLTDEEAVTYETECAPKSSDTATIKGSKLEYHLLPPEQLAGMAEILNKGEKTHKTGYMEINPLHYWNAVMRHLMALRRGELADEEGNSHALAIACNGVILDRQLKAGKELRFER